MFALLALGVVDWLLPAVQIPLFAWILLILLWICRGAVHEAAKTSKKFSSQEDSHVCQPSYPELSWIVSPQDAGLYSTTEGDWQLYGKDGEYWLFGEGMQEVKLTANNLSAAMDQADVIITTLTPIDSTQDES